MSTENTGWDPLRVDLLWNLKPPPRRGPKPALSVRKVAQAGVELADAEGLGAVSMQRLADRLGVGTMTVYTYVPDKASLLEVMLDLAFAAAAPNSGDSWRNTLEEGAYSTLASYAQHPWALQVFVGGPPTGPSQIRFLEACLKPLAATSLSPEEQLDAVMAVAAYVRGSAHISIGILDHIRDSGIAKEELQAAYGLAYERVLNRDEFPRTYQALGPGSWDPSAADTDEDYGFQWGLDRLLDGIEARIATM